MGAAATRFSTTSSTAPGDKTLLELLFFLAVGAGSFAHPYENPTELGVGSCSVP
jgi:hypothetical protein